MPADPTARGASAPFPTPFFGRSHVLLIAALAVMSGLYALYWTPYAIDDAWITYRYAEHIGSGQGFVYNAGEKVLGTSTPLYTLLLSAAHAMGVSVPIFSYVVGYVAAAGCLLGIYLLTRLWHSELAALLAVSFVVMTPYFHRVATYGMETVLYACLIVLAFYMHATNRRAVATALAALCLLTRLDGAAVGASLFLADLLEHRRVPWKRIALYVAIVAPWFAFSYGYFGSFLPNSFVAKRQHTGTALQGWLLRWLLARSYTIPAAVGGLALLYHARTRFVALPFAIWSVAYVTAYTFSSLWRYEWYFTPLTVPLGGFAAVGVSKIAEWFFGNRRAQGPVVAALTLALLAPDLYSTTMQVRQGRYRNLIESARYDAALWMHANVPQDAMISTGGIGIVGYITGNYILDSAGLVSPQVLGHMNATAFFQETAVERFHPQYVLVSNPVMPAYMDRDYVFIKDWETGHPDVPLFRLACRLPCGGQTTPR